MSDARAPSRNAATEASPGQVLRQPGSRAHQRRATTRAADHFSAQDAAADRNTGSWLVASACNLAQQLASEIDDGMATVRRPAADKGPIEPHDPALARARRVH